MFTCARTSAIPHIETAFFIVSVISLEIKIMPNEETEDVILPNAWRAF